MGSDFALTVLSLRISEMSAVPRPPESGLHISIEPQRKYTAALLKSLKPSVVQLLLCHKQAVTAIVPLPSVYCNVVNDSHVHRCFL
jgi:hypothetical protein